MFRKAIANKIEGAKNEFRFRGHEVKRIEAFSDAVFAFAVTLLIVVTLSVKQEQAGFVYFLIGPSLYFFGIEMESEENYLRPTRNGKKQGTQ